MVRVISLLPGLVGCVLATTAAAQEQQPEGSAATQHGAALDDRAYEEDAIVVTGGRLPGSTIGTIQPEIVMSPADIRSYGVSSMSELLSELAPLTASGRGRGESPVVLLNGRRISSFAEMRDIPTEAIRRVEILPEEEALKYGYSANQRVVNVVLRSRFNAITGELEGRMPTAGGQFSTEADVSLLKIDTAGRLNLALKYDRSSALYENERDIIPNAPRQPYDIFGNTTATVADAEIDPALSSLAGRPITIAGVPASARNGAPGLTDFAGTAGITNITDTGRYRTLLPATDTITFNAVLNRTVFGNVPLTINGTLTYDESDSAQGLGQARLLVPGGSPWSPFASDIALYRYVDELGALAQNSRNLTGHLGLTMNGDLASWKWSLTGNYDRVESWTRTDTGVDLTDFQTRISAGDAALNPFAPIGPEWLANRTSNRARSTTSTGNLQLVLNGNAFELPAGPVSTTLKLGGETGDFDSRSTRSGLVTTANLARDIASAQFSVDVPLTSRRDNVLAAIGDLSANFNIAYDHLSDFGTLRTIGYGLNWTPVKPINIIISATEDEGAPTVQQLGNPTILTTGARVFDYVRGETVDITRLTGGNPALGSDQRHVFKAGVTVKPFDKTDLTLTANYVRTRTDDPIASFPSASAAIEAAFPDRFTRDDDGRLLRIDSRPVNFARQRSEQLRWGFNFSKQISTPAPAPRAEGQGQPMAGQAAAGQSPAGQPSAGQAPAGEGGQPQPSLRDLMPGAPPPAAQAETPRSGAGASTAQNNSGGAGASGRPPQGGPGFGGPGRGFGGPGGGRGTRLQLAAYHTWHFREDILVHEGGPLLDLLNGDAIGSSGGQPRHEVEVQAGLMRNGLGIRLSGNWQSATTVSGGLAGNARDLRFSDLATLNLRLFANLGQQRSLVERFPFLRGTRITFSVTNLFDSHQHVRDVNGDTPISYQPDYLDPLGRSVRLSIRKVFF